MPLINGVPFYEDSQDPKSPEQAFANDNGRTTRTLHIRAPGVAQADEPARFAAAKALIGYATVNLDAGGSMGANRVWINRSSPATVAGVGGAIATNTGGALPAGYPAVVDRDVNPVGNSFQWCTNIMRTVGLGASPGVSPDGTAIYPGARFTCQHNVLNYQIFPDSQQSPLTGPLAVAAGGPARPDEGWVLGVNGWPSSRFISRYFKPGSRIITLPNGMMQNVRTGKPVAQGLAVRESYGILKFVWMSVPLGNQTSAGYRSGLPQKAWGACLNHVSNATFDGFPAGTLLLTNVEFKQYQNSISQWLCDVCYEMEYLPHFDVVSGTYRGHNSVLLVEQTVPKDPTTGRLRYDYFTSDGAAPGAGNTAFPPADLQSLFRPDQS